jgi:hypothetical protein
MKKHFLLLGVLVNGAVAIAQQNPTNNNPVNPAQNGRNDRAFWSRAGNTDQNGSNNIFGTLWNSPIYTVTNGANRMKLNGSVAYAVNGFPGARNGYLLLGDGSGLSAPLFTGAATGAYSQLHLTGNDGAFIPSGGYRPWMKTGITLTDNQDLSYFGVRNVLLDVNETVIAWSDNAGTSGSGPDDMVFRFLSGDGGTINITDLISDADLDGLHIARFTGVGNFGLGNTFGSPVGPLYVTPQSLAHYSLSNLRSVWQQFTNRNVALGSGTSETASDGLRIGIIGNTNLNVNGTAAIYNQENRHLLFSTNANTTAMNVLTGNTLERMRITSIGTQTNLPIGGFGVYNPGLFGTNLTRVAISHNPAQPVTRPLSLLHLGYNTGLISSIVGATDGWRSWMDIGTFTTNGTDNIYVGLKNEGTDRFDAVINWGDNQVSGLTANDGPDHLRFIFTSTTTSITGPGDSISQSFNGLETGRFYPGYDTTFSYLLSGPLDLYGRFGVGDFTASGVNEEPTHKLDVIGNGRFRYLPDSLYLADNLVNKYVMVDSMGVLRWSNASPSFGAICSDTVNGKLQNDTKVDLNNYNLYFTKNDSLGVNHVSVGYDCGDVLPAKLSVYQAHPAPVNQSTIGVSGINVDTASVINLTFAGVEGRAIGEQPQFLRSRNIGGNFYAASADLNYGVYGIARPDSMLNSLNTGGQFDAGFGLFSFGVAAQGGNASVRNIGVSGIGTSPFTPSSLENIGGQFIGAYSNGTNYGVRGVANFGTTAIGVYGAASGATIDNFAGYFDGPVYISGTIYPSDANFKANINTLQSADSLLNLLNPVSYDYKTDEYPQFNFDEENQMGLLAQEVEQILPTIVKTKNSPVHYDSLGNELFPSVEFKSLDYTKLIPLLVAGHKEQATIIDSMSTVNDSLQSQISDLNNRLTQLENCLSGILPFLCQMSNSAIQPTQEEVQNQLRTAINVNLSDRNAIVLNQNVPNPFAESTVITYSIPASVQKAQIHFYDGQGKLINSVDVVERGNGQLNVFANDLSTGVYTYSLVADGQVVATKRMMKQ